MPQIHQDPEWFDRKETIGFLFLFSAFFLSGMSGLIYQTVWVRMLTRYLGSTTAATATVLCVFMGGLALGAWLGGRLADQIKRKLTGYVILELCIAAAGILMSFLIVLILGGLYVNFYPWFGVSELWLHIARIVFCMICLLLPTVLMGATLPLLVAHITQNRYGFQQGLGHLYSINTFGAVLGVLLTGFVLIGALGERSSLLLAALLNILAAFFVYRFDRQSLYSDSKIQKSAFEISSSAIPSLYPAPIMFWSRIAIFVSGFSALAYEILWTRFLMLPLRTSIYAFSLMLAIFLLGIAFGSWLSTRVKISESRPAAMFALFEILIGFLTATGMIVFLVSGQISEGFTGGYLFGILTSILIVFPVAVIFGWQFPIAVRCCISDSSYPGRETGWAYSANTAGAILGSILAGFVMIPLIGTTNSFILIALLNTTIGIILLCLISEKERGKIPALAGLLTVIFVLMIMGTGDPYKKVIQERVYKIMGKNAVIYAFHEDVAGNTVPAGSPENRFNKQLFINGIGMTTLVTESKLMAHLPMALISDPKKVLVICFGMGTTVRSASRYPARKGSVEISAVDIVPKVFDCFKYFHDDAKQVISLPNVHLHADDGRNYLLVHPELYDVITIDPAPPVYSAGTVNLYTREFFELCKSRINGNGVVCLWLYQTPLTESAMIMKTFVDTFPGATLWGGLGHSGFYLIGGHRSFDQTDKSLAALAKKLSEIKDISEWNASYGNEENLRQLYLLGSKDFSKLVEPVWEVTDDRPYTEFPIWRGVLTGKVPVLTAQIVRDAVKNASKKHHL